MPRMEKAAPLRARQPPGAATVLVLPRLEPVQQQTLTHERNASQPMQQSVAGVRYSLGCAGLLPGGVPRAAPSRLLAAVAAADRGSRLQEGVLRLLGQAQQMLVLSSCRGWAEAGACCSAVQSGTCENVQCMSRSSPAAVVSLHHLDCCHVC
jgi:hypothetical protein